MWARHDRIVDHHVQPIAPLDGGADEPVDVVPSARVRRDEDGAPTLLGDQLDCRPAALAWILANVADHNAGPLAGEGQRHGAAQARRSAGDDDRLAGEPVGQLRSPFARPPSTRMVMPFRYAARVEQRNAHRSPISAGSPNRRAGISPSSRRRSPSGSAPPAYRFFIRSVSM